MQDTARLWRESCLKLHRALCECNDPVNCLAKGCITEGDGDPSTGGDDGGDGDLIALLDVLEKQNKEEEKSGTNSPEDTQR